jgi:hypothetical protein
MGHGDHDKGWGSIRVDAGAMVIAGTGVINLKSKGRLLNIGGDKSRWLTLDGVTLVGLPDNDSSLVGVGENSELILKSGVITGNTRVRNEGSSGGGVEVHRGTFTMEGGEISGNSAIGTRDGSGGGVNIGEDAVFTMRGGTITGNSARGEENSGNGGGVNVSQGTFIMEGGEITSNIAEGIKYGGAGGVRVSSGNFTMSSGAISGNTATSSGHNGNGGGVYLSGGSSFTMRNGTISGNIVTGKNASECGGVQVNESVFVMEGGTIYGSADSLPAGTDPSLANSARSRVALRVWQATAKWGTGGTYTKGGVSQVGGSDIVLPDSGHDVGSTDVTLIAVPAP